MIQLEGVSKAFAHGSRSRVALADVSLGIREGEFVVVVGHNGSGKTTLINILCGEMEPDSGTVALTEGTEKLSLRNLSGRRRASLIGRVFQNPSDGVFLELKVWENLHVATTNATPSPFSFGSRRRIERELADDLGPAGLSHLLDSKAGSLSGGERQILALEMSILRGPSVLLLDEHTSALDARNGRWCMEYTVAAARKHQMTTVAVTHDLAQALEFGDRLVVLREGSVIADVAGAEKRRLTLAGVASLCGFSL